MATVHLVIIYYKEKDQETGNQILLHKSIVLISDCLTHNTVLVHVFQKKLTEFLRGIFPNLKKLYYLCFQMAQQLNTKAARILLIFVIAKQILMELRASGILMQRHMVKVYAVEYVAQ